MNIKEYIKSGIVESYVLGLATKTEQDEFEALCLSYPELLQARLAFEIALEEELRKEVAEPSRELKARILNVVGPYPLNGGFNKEKLPVGTGPVTPVKRINVWKWIAVASLILLAGSLYWGYSVTVEYQKLQTVQVAGDRKVNPYEDPHRYEDFKSIVQRPSIKWSIMVEPENSGHCMAHVYWDSLSKGTYLLVGNIPPRQSDKQFQLWAVENDQTINLGIFDIKKEGQLVQMKSLPSAKSFIITMEPRGGSPSPSMGSMYAIGSL
ncbi:MAG TPA: anti-sigma factor [Chitinophagaceae bacterium]|nr:anti-sigma factor [Chitinophagaceae bacterium]